VDTLTLEQRVAKLERELELLKQQSNGKATDWYDSVTGSMKDIPEEVYREFRNCCSEVRESFADSES